MPYGPVQTFNLEPHIPPGLGLRARFTDLFGHTLAVVTNHEGIDVTWPLSDSRTGKVTLSIYDEALSLIRPLDTLCYIEYGSALIFSGYVLKPSWGGKAGTVELNLHDATLKLKHHYAHWGDAIVDIGYPVDGIGLRLIIEASVPTQKQSDEGVPPNGILWGLDTSTHQPFIDVDGAVWSKAERGAEIWDTCVKLSQAVIGPDFEFEPIDDLHPPIAGVLPDGHSAPGFMAQVNAADHLGSDLSDTVRFDFNTGLRNAEDFVWEPDGDVVRNFGTQVNPGGPRSRDDDASAAHRVDLASTQQYGLYESYESAGQTVKLATLKARAQAVVDAYAQPPDFFTVDPKADGANVPRLGTDYKVGDTINATAKRGQMWLDLKGRVVQATVTQRSRSGGANVSLTCVPTIAGGSVDASDGDA